MIRVHVICEGQTEEMFINEVLAKTYLSKGIYLLPSLIGKPGHKGGYFSYPRLLTDLRIRLLSDRNSICTTMFDFYGLPERFPGKNEAITKPTSQQKAECLLNILMSHLQEDLGGDVLHRFIPNILMYEFEGLLFSDPKALATSIDASDLTLKFQKIRDNFHSPEDINNSPMTAPSKRIQAIFPEYDKVLHGSLASIEIGLNTIREECELFNNWLVKLEGLVEEY